MVKKFRLLGLAAALVLVMVLAACGGGGSEEESDSDSGDNGNGGGDDSNGSVELGESDLNLTYVAWAGALVRTPLIQEVLEEVGYNVDTTQVEAGAMWSSVAQDDASFMTASWLPTTHGNYLEQYGDDVEVIGEFVAEAPLAMTVPSYMDVNSIEDLQDNEELGEELDWTITGIDPGAGVMQSTETAIEEYGLENWELMESSEAAMLSELQTRIENEEPIIVPGWEPHWKFAELDLKMLEDPQEIYGGDGDRIEAIAHTSFQEDSPAAYEVMQRITEDYDTEMENELLVAVNDGVDEEDAASQFLEDNPDLLEKWTEGIGE
ncbi:glycine betaine/proline transport system substrate-binding protein [Virgibacillus natechei]|uniref:Glycine betaine/proline transport system substrate-binding protein n=1 Tax=Virgibacillus natechei TaxID=1216297 RepID=A0ABS4IDG9_9BACI|nr:glycine betaine ABC transporter substrate-binding protein [Virgibacillus natechei]MBP1968983.1 glycine betaine/proline transport system substrate-binding protein [Virgibacillus natechei]UZD14260.1 glycine betaine ABC transporter substrate-binding protein [Virgibacillus natechei]